MKLLVKTVASTAVVLVALAGCASRSSGGGTSAAGSGSDVSSSTSPGGSTSTQNGSQPGASSSAPGGSPSTGSTSGGQAGSGSQSGSAPSTDPNAQVKHLSPAGVSLDKDGITLVTEVAWGGCNDQPQLVVLSQDASKVVVELKQTSHQRVGVMCPDIAREGAAKVKLAAPLGSRQVIDGIKNVPLTVH